MNCSKVDDVTQECLTFRNVDRVADFRRLGDGAGAGGGRFLVAAVSHRLTAKHVRHFVHHTTLDDATHVAVAGSRG